MTLPDLPAERYQDVALRYRQHYMARDHELLLFDGAEALIDELAAAIEKWTGIAPVGRQLGGDASAALSAW